jgi:hypothetical protein
MLKQVTPPTGRRNIDSSCFQNGPIRPIFGNPEMSTNSVLLSRWRNRDKWKTVSSKHVKTCLKSGKLGWREAWGLVAMAEGGRIRDDRRGPSRPAAFHRCPEAFRSDSAPCSETNRVHHCGAAEGRTNEGRRQYCVCVRKWCDKMACATCCYNC